MSRLHGLYGYVVPFLQYFSDDKKIQQEPCIAFLLENVFFFAGYKNKPDNYHAPENYCGNR